MEPGAEGFFFYYLSGLYVLEILSPSIIKPLLCQLSCNTQLQDFCVLLPACPVQGLDGDASI